MSKAKHTPGPFKKGDRVRIFQDPVTEEDFEGHAVIRKVLFKDTALYCGGTLDRYSVEFDDEPGRVFERTILSNGKNAKQ